MSSESLNQKFLHVPFPAFLASVCIHASILIFLIVVRILDHYGIHLFKQTPRVTIAQQFIQVDVVGMPTELPSERKAVDPTLPIVASPKTEKDPTTEPKPDDKPEEKVDNKEDDIMAEKKKAEEKAKEELKKKEDAKKLAQKKEKEEREKALKKLQEDASREAALKALKEKGTKQGRKQIAGNLTSKGTALTGKIGTAKEAYTALVAQKIKEHFIVYQWQKKKGLSCVVTFELLPNGRVRSKKIVKPSTDPTYNQSALNAIDAAQPLPVPEDKSLIADGLTIDFRPED